MNSFLNKNNLILEKFDECKVFAAEAIFKKGINKWTPQYAEPNTWYELTTDSQRTNIRNFFWQYSEEFIKSHDIDFLNADFGYQAGYLLSEEITGIKGQYYIDDFLQYNSEKKGKKMIGLENDKDHYRYVQLSYSMTGNIIHNINEKIQALDSTINVYKANKSLLIDNSHVLQ